MYHVHYGDRILRVLDCIVTISCGVYFVLWAGFVMCECVYVLVLCVAVCMCWFCYVWVFW